MATSQILKFYEDANVFITGGTGFLGKILIEKLLRSTSVSTLYILVRAKKGKNAESRIKDIFDDVIFQRLHAECPKFIHKIVGINGDVSLPDLGISQEDKQILFEKIHIVFHAAATVRFDENLKLAYDVNVNGAKATLELGKQMKNLKALMHVSTAFSNCYMEEIDEKFYEYDKTYEEIGTIVKNLSESQVEMHTPRIIGQWPNTYTFTKALAESVIMKTSGDVPIGVFRPAIVISTYKEPTEGWINNLYGPTGVCAGVSSGLLRVLYACEDKAAAVVPVDMCVAALIAAAWDTSQKHKTRRSEDDIPIYNYASTENPITWRNYCTLNLMYGDQYPVNRTIWTHSLKLTRNYYLYTILKIVFHLIPALIIDFVSMLFFKNLGLLGMYKKIHKFTDVLGYFSTRQWNFRNDNVVKLWSKLDETEREVFYFDMASLDWWAYFKTYLLGMRKYIMKESLDTLQAAKQRKRIFDYMHQILVSLINFTISVMVWTILQRLVFSSSTYCEDYTNVKNL